MTGDASNGTAPRPGTSRNDVRIYTIADARARVQDTLEHLPLLGYDGYFIKGWTHLLAGWWRLGKSELMAAVVAPWMRLGNRIIWITEEPDSVWADRADVFDEIYQAVPWDRLQLIDALSASPKELLDAVCSMQADVVIADTIREVCGIESMKDDESVHRALSPWLRRLRDGRRTLIFIAQHRKQAGERGERVMGSVTLPAKMDVVLELEAVDGQERQRRLTVRQRRSQTPPLLLEMDEDERIGVVPDGRRRERKETEETVITILEASKEPLSTSAVRDRMQPKPDRTTVHRVLNALAHAGRIRRDPPIDEPAERRAVHWTAAVVQPDLLQQLHSVSREFAATEDRATDPIGASGAAQPGNDPLPDESYAPTAEDDDDLVTAGSEQ